jgi:hypothetical protein
MRPVVGEIPSPGPSLTNSGWKDDAKGLGMTRVPQEEKVVHGTGPRMVEFETTRAAKWIRGSVAEDGKKVVLTFDFDPVNEERTKWQGVWWSGPEVFKSGPTYEVSREGEDMAGNGMLAVSKEQKHLSEEELYAAAEDSVYGKSFIYEFTFDKNAPNPNLSKDWAQALLKKHGMKPKK